MISGITVLKNYTQVPDSSLKCDFIFYDYSNNTYDIVTLFRDKATHSFLAPGSLLRFSDKEPRVLRYIQSSEKDVPIRKVETVTKSLIMTNRSISHLNHPGIEPLSATAHYS